MVQIRVHYVTYNFCWNRALIACLILCKIAYAQLHTELERYLPTQKVAKSKVWGKINFTPVPIHPTKNLGNPCRVIPNFGVSPCWMKNLVKNFPTQKFFCGALNSAGFGLSKKLNMALDGQSSLLIKNVRLLENPRILGPSGS